MANSLAHVRQAFRKLMRSPLFTVLSVLTLALGIGANIAIFSVVNTVLIRPLPYANPKALVAVPHQAPGLTDEQLGLSDASYLFYRQHSKVFKEIGIYSESSANLQGGAAPERVTMARMTPSALTVLGQAPAVGRAFVEAEQSIEAEPVAVLGHSLAARRFGAAERALGQTIRVDSVTRTVVGVMPTDFHFPTPDTELWVPLWIKPRNTNAGSFRYSAIARLHFGVTLEQADVEVSALAPRVAEEYPGSVTREMLESIGLASNIVPLKQTVVGDVGRVL